MRRPQRCEKAGIPEDQRRFLTKPGIALQSIRHQRQLDIGFDCVSMDSGYGSGQAFPHALDRDGETFAAEVHCNHRVWVEAPWPHRQGARPSQTLLHTKVAHPGQSVDAWAAAQPDTAWRRLKTRDSGQGPFDEEDLRSMLESRIQKRQRDQVRRRTKARADRPPLWPDEILLK